MKKIRTSYHNWGIHNRIRNDVMDAEESLGRKFTRDELLDYVFGSFSDKPECKYELYIYEKPETNVIHRLNCLWAFPLTLLCSPYQFVKYGDIGWSHKTRFGKFILTCTGFIKPE